MSVSRDIDPVMTGEWKSATPLTDALIARFRDHDWTSLPKEDFDGATREVLIEFARHLEHDLTTAKIELAETKVALGEMKGKLVEALITQTNADGRMAECMSVMQAKLDRATGWVRRIFYRRHSIAVFPQEFWITNDEDAEARAIVEGTHEVERT